MVFVLGLVGPVSVGWLYGSMFGLVGPVSVGWLYGSMFGLVGPVSVGWLYGSMFGLVGPVSVGWLYYYGVHVWTGWPSVCWQTIWVHVWTGWLSVSWLTIWGTCWDWLAQCQYTVTVWDSKLDLQFPEISVWLHMIVYRHVMEGCFAYG